MTEGGKCAFDIGPSDVRALGELASRFLRDLQTFGRLTVSVNLTEDLLSAYIADRAGFVLSYLRELETRCGLRFARSSGLAFCYNTASWPDAAPPSGYTGTEGAVLPSHFARSMVLAWSLRTKHSFGRRLLLGATWQISSRGFQAGIDWLFDLYDEGFIGTDDLHSLSLILFVARANVEADHEMVARFHPTLTRSDDRSGWTHMEPETAWVQSRELNREGRTAMSRLFRRTVARVERVRSASNLDEWVVGSIHVAGLLTVASRLITGLLEEVPLTWRARLSQWEEIVADAGGIIRLERAGFDAHSFVERAGYIRVVGEMIRSKVGEEWRRRLYEDRLLVPRQLQQELLFRPPDQPIEVPERWASLSWKVIYPWTKVVHPERDPNTIRAYGFTAEDLLGTSELTAALTAANSALTAEARRELVGRYLQNRLEQVPDPDRLKVLLDETVPRARAALARAELIDELNVVRRLLDEGVDTKTAATLASSVLHRYPYFAAAWLELAIAHDMSEEREQALECLIKAVMLRPQLSSSWHSLYVVLSRLGNRDESILAGAYATVLEEATAHTPDA